MPADPEMLAVWQNRLWVTSGQQGAVVALDPATGHRIGRPVSTPGIIRQTGGRHRRHPVGHVTANPGTVIRFS